ncbi:MAG TPA: dihydrofolate reductase family protein [Chloroflexia bacterium]|nr:dihydrofolate reductase family protein [Chloroflexia bacterium]
MEIILMAAVTLDGKLARHAAHLSDWTSPEDKKLFRTETRRAGVIILGHNTFRTLALPLPGRLHIVLTRDRSDKVDIPGVVEYTAAPPATIATDLAARGYTRAILVGGAQANALFLAADLVDEIWLTVEPVIFGQGLGLFAGMAFERRARLVSLTPLNADAFLARYRLRSVSE